MAKQPTTPSEAAKLSQEAYKAAKANLDTITYAMSQKTASIFHETVAKARVRVNEVGEKAMAEAVQELAAQGIYASSHTDKNGRGYRVPADVAVRQAVYTSGRQRFNGQVLGVAQRTGQDLIEVSSTPNCRPSHEVINGKIFSISGQDRRCPKWTADLEALTHDYNCGHSIAIYHEGMERVFSDPLEGTGYSVEEARKAYAKQRRYESQIRKQKRTVEALKAAGLETREANAQLNALRHRLKKHIEDNSAILRRERHREQLYDSAQRMKNAKRIVPTPAPKKPSVSKVANVSGNAFEKVVQTVAAKGTGATVFAETSGIQRKSIGAADIEAAYSAYKQKHAIEVKGQEFAIIRSAFNNEYWVKHKDMRYSTVVVHSVDGYYEYTVRVFDYDMFVIIDKERI